MTRASAEFSGTIATVLFALAIPCAILIAVGLAAIMLPLSPFMAIVWAAYWSRVKADADWNEFADSQGKL